jgi:hypothetical protein
VGGAGLVALPPEEGAGLVVPVPPVGLAGAPGSEGMVRFGFCASGMTRGPFCPHANSEPAQITRINGANFMF